MPQLYLVGFAAGTLSVVFDLSWNTLFLVGSPILRLRELPDASE